MAYLHWSNDLDTGIEVIDKQHQRIVDYLNELNNANDTGDQTATNHVLNELVDYTLTHFAFEEELQEKAQYPFLKAHKRVHEIFTKRVAEFQQRAAAGENVAPELLSMLKIWLVNHIKGDDADYVESVKKMLGFEGTGNKVDGGWLGTALKKFFG
ncbi:bacteriohemerythrin [Sideroxydans lithotrophicus]|uniref:Hemerythrin-like metal-binding protein n=1 Tax=Sideroxydans lithotrophicus (strain ES-1) TaxID=580332 RepID=D5CPQ2_SIDLE|nr:bacteriohemerythrin [Sideroxydans lithotrophicus]ADE13047.1 hemerythrin-like metal-binding protein [Sideroxydans lithotrophicus ES-1]